MAAIFGRARLNFKPTVRTATLVTAGVCLAASSEAASDTIDRLQRAHATGAHFTLSPIKSWMQELDRNAAMLSRNRVGCAAIIAVAIRTQRAQSATGDQRQRWKTVCFVTTVTRPPTSNEHPPLIRPQEYRGRGCRVRLGERWRRPETGGWPGAGTRARE